MKIEIKNISIKSLLLSAFPLLVFGLCTVNNALAVFDLDELTFIEKLLQLILWSISNTIVILMTSVVGAFVYNLFCSFGIKGLTISLEEPVSKEEEVKETSEQL